MSPGFLSYTLWGLRRGTCKGVKQNRWFLGPLIPRQSENTPRTPMREAPQIHHWGPLLLSVTSHLLEHSPEIRDRKFFRSTAGISLPRGFDDSGSDGQALFMGVCKTQAISCDLCLKGLLHTLGAVWSWPGPQNTLLHLMHMQAQGIGFLTAEGGTTSEKKLIIWLRNGSSMGKYGFWHSSFYSNYFWFWICRWVCACKCMCLRIP